MGQEGKFSLVTFLCHLNIVIYACLKHFVMDGLLTKFSDFYQG